MDTYQVYIIQSEKSGRFYTGVSNNINRRIHQHNLGLNKSTKNKGPWYLVYSSQELSKSQALALEKKIKKNGAKRYIERSGGHA